MATSVGQEYRCKVCGNKVKVVEAGGGVLVCCGIPMKLESGTRSRGRHEPPYNSPIGNAKQKLCRRIDQRY